MSADLLPDRSYARRLRLALAVIRQGQDVPTPTSWVGIVLGLGDPSSVLFGLAELGKIERAGTILPGDPAWIAVEWGTR